MMKYMITGGTGFLGSYICKELLADGDSVVCYDYAPNANSIQQVLTEEEMKRVTLVQGDIRDALSLIHVCQEEKVEKIIHVAGLLQSDSEKNIPATVDTNIMGTVNVFEAARVCGIKRVAWASSNSSIGCPPGTSRDTALPNDSVHHPITVYGQCKSFNEFIGEFYNQKYGLETVALRYTVLYGMARLRGGSNWILGLMNQPAVGIPSQVPFGDMAPNFLYIKDAAHATVLAARAEHLTRSAYTIGGDIKTLRQVRDYVLTILPDAKIELLPGDMGLHWKYETEVEERDLGYKPQYTAEMGAHETINAVRAANNLPPV